jgi:hypothetical protein
VADKLKSKQSDSEMADELKSNQSTEVTVKHQYVNRRKVFKKVKWLN